MDPLKNPALDKAEFSERLENFVKHAYEEENLNLLMSTANAKFVEKTRSSKRIQAYQNWKQDLLSKWDAASEEGRASLVGSVLINDEDILNKFSPFI